jgi:hypothetical protein
MVRDMNHFGDPPMTPYCDPGWMQDGCRGNDPIPPVHAVSPGTNALFRGAVRHRKYSQGCRLARLIASRSRFLLRS